MYLVTAQEMRELDRLTIEQYGIPGHVLMERAGSGASDIMLQEFPHVRSYPVLVVAGRGNNGGDGLVIARCLKRRKVKCQVALVAKKAEVRGDAQRNLAAFLRVRGRVKEVTKTTDLAYVQEALAHCGLVVDALLGTGLHTPVTDLYGALIELINASGVPVLAVDMPSGLDADRGIPLGTAIQAEVTVTFGFPKVGQLVYPGAAYVGKLIVVDIGIPRPAVEEVHPQTEVLVPEKLGLLLGVRNSEAHKGDFGHLLIVAGSRGKTGAAILCSQAAARAGAGLVTLASPASLNNIFSGVLREVMTSSLPDDGGGHLCCGEGQDMGELLEGKKAIVLGPGIGVTPQTVAFTGWLLRSCQVPVVIDADGLTCLATDLTLIGHCSHPPILTPHPGEMARLIGGTATDVQNRRLEVARSFAQEHRCYLILKGARTLITTPEGKIFINPTGNPGMASGGMGDVLAGMIGAFLSQGCSQEDAATLAVYLHGFIGDCIARERGEVGILAGDLIDGLPRGIAALREAAFAYDAS